MSAEAEKSIMEMEIAIYSKNPKGLWYRVAQYDVFGHALQELGRLEAEAGKYDEEE